MTSLRNWKIELQKHHLGKKVNATENRLRVIPPPHHPRQYFFLLIYHDLYNGIVPNDVLASLYILLCLPNDVFLSLNKSNMKESKLAIDKMVFDPRAPVVHLTVFVEIDKPIDRITNYFI